MAKIKSISRRKIESEKLYNLAVEDDESYTANGVVVHNCRSTLIPITKFEKFEPDTEVITIEDGEPQAHEINQFIKDNLGEGFSKQ